MDLEKNWRDQTRRAQLEDSRFSMGRSPILNVVQAGDDATTSETQYRQAQAQAHLTAWQVQKLADGFREYLTSLKMDTLLDYAPAN
jgi:hypothetical protein